jgi:RNA polymerase sigma-70 factor (ECF subfamily)
LGATDEPGPGEHVLAASRRGLLRRLLDELPEAQATALVLHCVGGLTLEEVAAATQSPLETARSRLRLGKAALRKKISGNPTASELLEVSS